MADPLSGVNMLVAVGSIDGIAGTAACLRHLGNADIPVIFTQAFQVNTIDPSKWPENSKVGFIDLGVNNEGQTPNPRLTVEFVKKIYSSGHSILFIADEHGKESWKSVLKECEHSRKELTIRPKNRGEKYPSSCAILQKALGASADTHTKALLEDGNQGDLMNFKTHYGLIFNNAIKSNMGDPTRRPYLARHMAFSEIPDEKIQGWMDEYAEIEANLPKILHTRSDLGDGISLYDGAIGRHDATSIFHKAYEKSSIVVLKNTPVFIGGKMQVGVSIATNNKDLNILKFIQDVGISASGMDVKANFSSENLEAAIKAVRAAVSK